MAAAATAATGEEVMAAAATVVAGKADKTAAVAGMAEPWVVELVEGAKAMHTDSLYRQGWKCRCCRSRHSLEDRIGRSHSVVLSYHRAHDSTNQRASNDTAIW